MDEYNIEKHRHHFAVWAAARAVQRGFAGSTTDAIERALGNCGIPRDIATSMEASDFDHRHDEWCRSVMDSLNSSYGQAAKIIAIYLKTVLVIPHPESALAHVAHPPIDSYVLRGLTEDAKVPEEVRARCRKLAWTRLERDEYLKLIELLRKEVCRNNTPFWHLEKYFSATGQLDHHR